MSRIICFEAFPTDRTNSFDIYMIQNYGFIEKSNSYGTYYYNEVSKRKIGKTERILKRFKFRSRYYDKAWGRSVSYRKDFFASHKGPYWCSYCGRRLKGRDLQVDHLIPVAKAKTSAYARFLLRINGINNVNNYRNLVASCCKCNLKKSDKMGFWVIKGLLGRHKIFWKIRNTIILGILILIGYEIYKHWNVIENIWENVCRLLK